jgi:hypothetical protein
MRKPEMTSLSKTEKVNETITQIAEFLYDTKSISLDDQMNALYELWPEITPREYLPAVRIYNNLMR